MWTELPAKIKLNQKSLFYSGIILFCAFWLTCVFQPGQIIQQISVSVPVLERSGETIKSIWNISGIWIILERILLKQPCINLFASFPANDLLTLLISLQVECSIICFFHVATQYALCGNFQHSQCMMCVIVNVLLAGKQNINT